MMRNGLFAVTAAVCDMLEARRLLATYVVPSGHTAAYLTNGDQPGRVEVHLDSPTAPPVASDPFSATTGQHVLDSGTNGTTQNPFLVVDRVWARWKPQADSGNPEGILIKSSNGIATARIESNNVAPPTPNPLGLPGEFWDRQYIVFSSTSSDTRIDGYYYLDTSVVGQTHIGEGVSNLIIRTNDVQASEYYSNEATNPGSRVVAQNLVEGVHLTVDTGAGTYETIRLGIDVGGFNFGFLGEEATVITGAGNCQVFTRGIDLEDQHTRVRVDFGDGSGTGNNFLDVQEFSTTTLAEAPGTNHVIVLEHAQVGAPALSKLATLLVEDESEVLDLDDNAFGLTKVLATADGTEVSDFAVALNANASIEGQTEIGVLTNEGDVQFTYDAGTTSPPTTVDQFKIGATATLPNSSGNVVIEVDADVTILAPTTGHSPSHIGDLTIKPAARLTVETHTDGVRVLGVGTIFIEKTYTAPDGTLDLKDNSMLVDYDGGSPVDDVRDLLFYANNADNTPNTGAWTDFGITSSTAAAVAQTSGFKTGIWYGEATDLFTSFPATWEGQSLDSSTVLLKYAFYGDANLDGRVNLQDFNRLAANFGAGTEPSTYDDYTTEELEDMLP